jgi:intracellular sulfur oxidation DsrE/DsrF family protein
MQYKLPSLLFLAFFLIQVTSSFGQNNEPTTGSVFNNIGAVFSLENLDFQINSSQHLKAIFDIDSKQTDPAKHNSIISSLHSYYIMHVRYGVPKDNIHLALVLYGSSTKDALLSSVYSENFNVDNPNIDLIKSLSDNGVEVFICGQSMSYKGYSKADLLPQVKVALSAMTVLTIYQMNNYALIKF